MKKSRFVCFLQIKPGFYSYNIHLTPGKKTAIMRTEEGVVGAKSLRARVNMLKARLSGSGFNDETLGPARSLPGGFRVMCTEVLFLWKFLKQ